MGNLQSGVEWPENFSGLVNLFPLPNFVLFPHVIRPLHIFEPRYCDMLHDSLACDGLIAMALLEPGWEPDYEGRPPIAPIVCIGKLISHAATDDNKHNILLAGMKRAAILFELDNDRTFRQAQVEILDDVYPAGHAEGRVELYQSLVDAFVEVVPDNLKTQGSFHQLISQQLPLGMLTDIITYSLNLPVPIKQQILAEANVDVRCRILVRCLNHRIQDNLTIPDGAQSFHSALKPSSEDGSSISVEFPPRFSSN